MSRPLHRSPTPVVLVAVGGGAGALSRFAVAQALPTSRGGWPVATLLVNLVGAFALGALLESLTRQGADVGARRSLRLLLGTGFCGAFTTYSTFAHDVQTLSHVSLTRACSWALAQVIAGIAAAAVGAWVGARFTPSPPDETAARAQADPGVVRTNGATR